MPLGLDTKMLRLGCNCTISYVFLYTIFVDRFNIWHVEDWRGTRESALGLGFWVSVWERMAIIAHACILGVRGAQHTIPTHVLFPIHDTYLPNWNLFTSIED